MFFKCSYLPKMGRNGPGLCRILHQSGGMEGHLLFLKRNSASIVVSTVNGSFHAVVAFSCLLANSTVCRTIKCSLERAKPQSTYPPKTPVLCCREANDV